MRRPTTTEKKTQIWTVHILKNEHTVESSLDSYKIIIVRFFFSFSVSRKSNLILDFQLDEDERKKKQQTNYTLTKTLKMDRFPDLKWKRKKKREKWNEERNTGEEKKTRKTW